MRKNYLKFGFGDDTRPWEAVVGFPPKHFHSTNPVQKKSGNQHNHEISAGNKTLQELLSIGLLKILC
jgi:hypothetical protein